MNPHQVTRDFEAALCEYTGAKYAVTTTSCTMALTIALAWYRMWLGDQRWFLIPESRVADAAIMIPNRTYVGVPAAALNAGWLGVEFEDEDWSGEYRLQPTTVWDSARRFTSNMYLPRQMQCVSFHWSKILGLSQGGAILHDNDEADAWLRRARFDGRTEGVPANEDQVQYPSWHAYLSPEVSAHGIMKLSLLPRHNADLPNSNYPDLSKMEAFQ